MDAQLRAILNRLFARRGAGRIPGSYLADNSIPASALPDEVIENRHLQTISSSKLPSIPASLLPTIPVEKLPEIPASSIAGTAVTMETELGGVLSGTPGEADFVDEYWKTDFGPGGAGEAPEPTTSDPRAKTIFVSSDGYLYVCVRQDWFGEGKNWMRVQLEEF